MQIASKLFFCHTKLLRPLFQLSVTHKIHFSSVAKTSHLANDRDIRRTLWGTSLIYHTRPFHFETSKRAYPHPLKKERGGEDASFHSSRFLGVADGVGGWSDVGIDAGLYSRELLFHVQRELGLPVSARDFGYRYVRELIRLTGSPLRRPRLIRGFPDPRKILTDAFHKTKSDGSSTCCLVFLDPEQRKIQSINLGDSGFILFRPSKAKILARSIFQLHDHNFPYQLGALSSDRPSDASYLEANVDVHDWVVLATDGLWDNMYDIQIIDILQSSNCPDDAADRLLHTAYQLSRDENWNSPFSEKEKRYRLYNLLGLPQDEEFFTSTTSLVNKALNVQTDQQVIQMIKALKGGKPDDISIIVARVV